MEKLTAAAEANDSVWVRLFPNVTKVLAAIGVIDQNLVLTQSNLTEKTNAYGEALSRLKADKIRDITRELENQRAILRAGNNPIAVMAAEGKNAVDDLIRSMSKAELGSAGIQEAVSLRNSITAQRIANAQRERLQTLQSSTRGATESSLLGFAQTQRPDLQEGLEKLFLTEKTAADQLGVSLIEVAKKVPALGQAFKALSDGNFDLAFSKAEEALKRLDPVVQQDLRTQLEYAKATRDTARSLLEQTAALESYKHFGAQVDADEEANKENTRKAIEAAIKAKSDELDVNVLRLRAAGLQDAADKQELLNIIAINEERKKQLGAAAQAEQIFAVPGEIKAADNAIKAAQIRVQALGQTSIDVAGEVARVVTDITTAVVNGTLKWADIGRSVLASFVRVSLEQFTGFLRDMQNTARAAQLIGAGAVANTGGGALPGSQGGGGFGNILSLGSNFLGGGGGFLSGLSNLFQGGGFASSFGFGSAPAGVSGPLMANGGFFSGGSALGGLLNFLPGIGGLLGGFLGGRGGNVGLGIAGSLAGTVAGSSASLLAGGTGGILTSLIPSLTPLLSNPWTAIIAAVVVLFASIFGAQKPDPTAILKAQFSGIFYDELEKQFKPGTVSVGVLRTADIRGSTVGRIRDTVQQALAQQAETWTAILNIFPSTVSDAMIPTLEAANAKLNDIFSRLKFTEGGSRNIQQELKDFQDREGARGFFSALRPTLAVGFEQSLLQAGLPRSAAAAKLGIGETIGFDDTSEGASKFVDAIAKAASIVSSFSKISARGASQFLSAADIEFTERRLSNLFTLSGADFTAGVDKIEEQLSPVIDFLKQSVSQASDLFGRGLMAALDAATASSAYTTFLQGLGAGTKDLIFQGITEAFIASAQFTDLLAPIQKTIREFTQEAIATGQAPDIDAFRRALLPDIESISTRAETLRPLIEALQELGLNINDSIKRLFNLPGASSGNFAPIEIHIHGDVTEENASDFARRVEAILRPQLPPPT
jgi:hypothetical protein